MSGGVAEWGIHLLAIPDAKGSLFIPALHVADRLVPGFERGCGVNTTASALEHVSATAPDKPTSCCSPDGSERFHPTAR